MANIYCTATSTGEGFITYKDRYDFDISGIEGNVWVLSDKPKATAWINRVSGTAKTKVEAQAIVDGEIEAAQAAWDLLPEEEKDPNELSALTTIRPTKYTLP